MKITAIRATPLYCRFSQPYHWAQGVNHGAQIVLIEIETDSGIVGVGESMGSPDNRAMLPVLDFFRPLLIGEPAHDCNRLVGKCYQAGFASQGTGSAPRYFAQAITGIEMALWDAVGKAAGQPLHRLLGGAVRDSVAYFGFIQGDTATELASHAAALVGQGFQVLYLKVGRGTGPDMTNARAVREAIGPHRLRLDANEAWDMLTARRMLAALEPLYIEMIEQPLPAAAGSAALAKLRAVSGIPIAADQAAYGIGDVYDLCRADAADLIVLGIHETGGVTRYRKAAAIAEAACVNLSNHGVFESGITTCAFNQVAATLPNLDDGNQIMWQLLEEDIVSAPSLVPVHGRLPIGELPGLGFTLAPDAVARAARAYQAWSES